MLTVVVGAGNIHYTSVCSLFNGTFVTTYTISCYNAVVHNQISKNMLQLTGIKYQPRVVVQANYHVTRMTRTLFSSKCIHFFIQNKTTHVYFSSC